MKTKNKAGNVDGFVLVVPKKSLQAYKKMAQEGKDAWLKYGALDYRECKGDDLKIKKQPGMPMGLSFTKLAKARANETVWFSFITFKNKKHRDMVNKKVMAAMSKQYADVDPKDFKMPFDVRRMAYGGFAVEVS